MNLIKRFSTLYSLLSTLWYLSGLSKEDLHENPELFTQFIQKRDSPSQAYIIGLSEEEENFKNSLNSDNKDTLIS